MSSLNQKRAAIAMGVFVVIATAGWKILESQKVMPQDSLAGTQTSNVEADAGNASPTIETGSSNEDVPTVSGPSSLSTGDGGTPEEVENLDAKVLPYEKEMSSLMKSSSKVYLSESEKFERRELLSNKEFVKSLGERLSSPAENFESKKTQNLALKLLLEADPSVSKEVAKGVVADPFVENPDQKLSDRKELAGLKGELMLLWTSKYPDDATWVESLLPGPVSKHVWKRVQAHQASNESLSANP